jgi:hypothetical protein
MSSNAVYAADYYWIGGSGNTWGIAPPAIDNVIFDDNSGFTNTNKTVTLNVAGYCHDMRRIIMCEAVPVFTGNNSLYIAGSLEIREEMVMNTGGQTKERMTSMRIDNLNIKK